MKVLELEKDMDQNNMFKSGIESPIRHSKGNNEDGEGSSEDMLLDQLRKNSRVLIAKKLVELEELLIDLYGYYFA